MNRITRLLAMLGVSVVAACTDPVPLPVQPAPPVERQVYRVGNELPLAVPRVALIERAGITGIYVLDHGRARFRMVKTGAALPAKKIEIVSGLTGGEIAVLGELGELYDGRPVSAR